MSEIGREAPCVGDRYLYTGGRNKRLVVTVMSLLRDSEGSVHAYRISSRAVDGQSHNLGPRVWTRQTLLRCRGPLTDAQVSRLMPRPGVRSKGLIGQGTGSFERLISGQQQLASQVEALSERLSELVVSVANIEEGVDAALDKRGGKEARDAYGVVMRRAEIARANEAS